MAINLATKYSDKIAERFKVESLTAGAANNDYTFEGVKEVKVYSVDTAATTDYTRSGSSRYGTPAELGDTTQTLSMSKDRSFTFTIDKGNDVEQMNIKGAARALRRQLDEVVIPEMDAYRFEVWCKKAGNIAGINAPTANTVGGLIMDATEVMDNAKVPRSARTLYVTNGVYKLIKQMPDWIGSKELVQSATIKGQVGELDGMKVVRVPSSYLPTGVYWLITHSSAVLAPAKLIEYKIHKDPPGINGNLVEGRFLHDAFVLGSKASGVYAAVNTNNKTAALTITDDANNAAINIATNTATATIYYTSDGTDPRYSDTAKTYSANIDYTNWANGTYTIKAYGADNTNSIYASDVKTATVTAS